VRDILLDKPLPSNTEFEQIILGAVLLNESHDQWLEVVDKLKPGDFHSQRNRVFYTAFTDLVNNGTPLNATTLLQHMQSEGTLPNVGGHPAISLLVDGIPRFTDLAHYVKQVKGKSLLRDAIRYAYWLAEESITAGADSDEVLALAEQKLAGLRSGAIIEDIVTSEEAVDRALAELVDRWERPNEAPGVQTGFADLDRKLHGLRPGRMHLLAARPGEGKTTLAMNIAQRAVQAKRERQSVVLFVSLEMLAKELMIRALSTFTRIDSDRIITGEITAEERTKVFEAAEQLRHMDMSFVEPKADLMASSIRTRINRLLHRYGHIDLLIIDYLQLLSPEKWSTSENERLTQISRGLKMISLNFSLPLLVLSQMNRDIEKRTTRRPQLSDLRGSGSLEQDSDVVAFLCRLSEEEEDEEAECVERELLIEKHRGGKTGSVPFLWFKKESRFEATAREYGQRPAPTRTASATKRAAPTYKKKEGDYPRF
jgi:replicative DNA helicase